MLKRIQFECRLMGVLLIGWSLMTGCASTGPIPDTHSSSIRIEDVPFFASRSGDCGPASLAMVLAYWSDPIAPKAVADQIYSTDARGTLTTDMTWFARERGFRAESELADMAELRRRIDEGVPVIVLVDFGLMNIQKDHYMVVTGYDKDSVLAHTGTEQNRVIRLERFRKTWERNNGWMLVIKPDGVGRHVAS